MIMELTMRHSWNLGRFVFIYKTLLVAMRRVLSQGHQKQWHSFVSGSIGGYLVFSADSAVNHQVGNSPL